MGGRAHGWGNSRHAALLELELEEGSQAVSTWIHTFQVRDF